VTAPVQIGSYRIERLLGVGSFAMVWLGYDSALDSHVAIKVLAENWSHDLRVRERFLDEARLLRWLDHERLVRVHAVGELADGRPYSVMAWADGGSLRDRLARGPLPAATAVRLLGEVAAGVAVLHRHGIVHRDLTPGNILFRSGTPADAGVGPDGEQVLIADLGLAKALAAASGLTARAGTPGYMAPEQDDPLAVVDTRADVFGLGRLGVRLLCVDAGRPGSGLRLRDGVPPRVAAVLDRATAAHPADRQPDAVAFRTALDRATTPAGQVRAYAAPRRYRVKVAGLAVVVVAAVGGTTAEPGGATTGTGPGGPGSATHTSGPITVTLPAGWRATGEEWAGQYGDDGDLEPALVMSPEPRRWAADPTLPGAFVGLSASAAARTTPAGFVAEHPHVDCTALPARVTRQTGVDWVVVTFRCDRGRPVIVEAAGLGPGRTGLVYVQITPPAGSGPGFVDSLLAGVRVR
jgi:hypothetical protein